MTAMGSLVHIVLEKENRLTARYGFARSMELPAAILRIRDFSQWPFSTTYAITRREHLIDRYERIKSMLLAGFYDFIVGAHDCVKGKFKGLPEIGFIRSRNVTHSCWRADDQLLYLRRGKEVIELMEKMRDVLLALTPARPLSTSRRRSSWQHLVDLLHGNDLSPWTRVHWRHVVRGQR